MIKGHIIKFETDQTGVARGEVISNGRPKMISNKKWKMICLVKVISANQEDMNGVTMAVTEDEII